MSDAATKFCLWAFGTTVDKMSDSEVRLYARRAWDTNDGDVLRMMRAEATRRGIQVI